MHAQVLSDAEFGHFQRFIFDSAGITLSSAKKALVSGRLGKRLHARRVQTFGDYFKLLKSGEAADEVQTAIDLLTTNETYFFREPRHFEVLREVALAHRARGDTFRVWSAASSSGEEAYSMAMVLADCLGADPRESPWEIIGSDISSRVLERARTGHYVLERTRHIPQHYLKRYCLRGIDAQQGTLLVDRGLRARVQFRQVNLNTDLPTMPAFDMVFLRNVLIYFNVETKRQVVARVLSMLKPGGVFCIGHSESLHDVNGTVQALAPSIYRKPG